MSKEIVQKFGYDGVATIELFRPEYYEMDPEDVIKKSKETMVEILSRNGQKLGQAVN